MNPVTINGITYIVSDDDLEGFQELMRQGEEYKKTPEGRSLVKALNGAQRTSGDNEDDLGEPPPPLETVVEPEPHQTGPKTFKTITVP